MFLKCAFHYHTEFSPQHDEVGLKYLAKKAASPAGRWCVSLCPTQWTGQHFAGTALLKMPLQNLFIKKLTNKTNLTLKKP